MLLVKDFALSPENTSLAIEALRRFGGTDHPYPEESSIPYFSAEYLYDCVRKAQAHNGPGPTDFDGLAADLWDGGIESITPGVH